MKEAFFQLIQVSLGHREQLDVALSERQWGELFVEAQRQAIAGVLLHGLDRLSKEQRPPMNLLLQWIGLAQSVQAQNAKMDQLTALVWGQLNSAGLDAVVLKGQGVACEYGELASLRQSGDIDIWVKGGFQTVCDYVQRTAPTDDVAYHRFHYPIFKDTEVELHFRPTLMRNLLDDRKLAKWYRSFGADSFVFLKERGFAIPSAEFNRIFILTHIYRHFLFEGVGLRQVMDLYFVLRNSTGNDKESLLLKDFRLMRFARAMMWVLDVVMEGGHGEMKEWMMCEPDEKEGEFLLNEIMQTGNFGYADERYQYERFYHLRHHLSHGSHLLLHYPSEVLWTPIWLIYHKVWKWKRKRETRAELTVDS